MASRAPSGALLTSVGSARGSWRGGARGPEFSDIGGFQRRERGDDEREERREDEEDDDLVTFRVAEPLEDAARHPYQTPADKRGPVSSGSDATNPSRTDTRPARSSNMSGDGSPPRAGRTRTVFVTARANPS